MFRDLTVCYISPCTLCQLFPPTQKISYTVPKVIEFLRYNMICSGENVILCGIFHVVSGFPLLYISSFHVILQKFGLLFPLNRKYHLLFLTCYYYSTIVVLRRHGWSRCNYTSMSGFGAKYMHVNNSQTQFRCSHDRLGFYAEI